MFHRFLLVGQSQLRPIADCEKRKVYLDKLDLNVAQFYAKKCRNQIADLIVFKSEDVHIDCKKAT